VSNAPKILVIDDETAILDTLRILLKREGFEVSTAIGGREGLERLPEIRPDVLLSDVRMPGVGGLEILLAAKEMDPTLPVILMTAQASLQTAIRAVNEGAFYYIQKPFANDELVAICRRAAESRQLKVENQALKTEIRRRERSDTVKPIGKSRRFLDVLKLAETVALNSPTAMRHTKKALWGALEAGLTDACKNGAQHLVAMWGHPDQEEGPAAFAEKREANWQPLSTDA